MAVLVSAIVKYRKGKLDPLILEFAAKCLNKYPNLIHAYTRIGVTPPVAVGNTEESVANTGDSDKESHH
jgi:hypothetical protein